MKNLREEITNIIYRIATRAETNRNVDYDATIDHLTELFKQWALEMVGTDEWLSQESQPEQIEDYIAVGYNKAKQEIRQCIEESIK